MKHVLFVVALGLALAGCSASPEKKSSIDPRLERHCGAMGKLGEYIGEARAAGKDAKLAADHAVSRFTAGSQPKDLSRLETNANIYAMLIYRLSPTEPETSYAYAFTSCLTIMGLQRAMPSDPVSEVKLDNILQTCEQKGLSRDALNACVLDGIKPMVPSFEKLNRAGSETRAETERKCIESPYKYIARVPGSCLDGGTDQLGATTACKDDFINSAFWNGRATFSFQTRAGSWVTFSGGKDSQPNPEEYRLSIDSIYFDKGERLKASGECGFDGDILKSARVTCLAKYEGKTVGFQFQTSGKPSWTNYCRPKANTAK